MLIYSCNDIQDCNNSTTSTATRNINQMQQMSEECSSSVCQCTMKDDVTPNSSESDTRHQTLTSFTPLTSNAFATSVDSGVSTSMDDATEDDLRPEVEIIASRLVADVVNFSLSREVVSYPEDATIDGDNEIGANYAGYRQVMLRIVKELTERYVVAFDEMSSRLVTEISRGSQNNEQVSESIDMAFESVIGELFVDERYNWGRVATVFALVASLTRRSADMWATSSDLQRYLERLQRTAERVIIDRLTSWIGANGGWDAFERFFRQRPPVQRPVAEPQSGLLSWRGLLVAAAGVGAVALINGFSR